MFSTIYGTYFSSPEHIVFRVSYCDSVVCVVRQLFGLCHIFSPIAMKLGQNICIDEISYEFENGSCQVKK